MPMSEFWVGMDVHQDSIIVAVFRDPEPEPCPVDHLPDDHRNLQRYLARDLQVRALHPQGPAATGGFALLALTVGHAFQECPEARLGPGSGEEGVDSQHEVGAEAEAVGPFERLQGGVDPPRSASTKPMSARWLRGARCGRRQTPDASSGRPRMGRATRGVRNGLPETPPDRPAGHAPRSHQGRTLHTLTQTPAAEIARRARRSTGAPTPLRPRPPGPRRRSAMMKACAIPDAVTRGAAHSYLE